MDNELECKQDFEKILVVDTGLGNVGSICNMLKYVGFDAYRSSNAEDISKAKKIILPGVGAFDAGMRSLHEAGIVQPLKDVANSASVPILGICLGMHLLFDSSEEGIEEGLGLIPGVVKLFTPSDQNIKVPHMGWNYVSVAQPSRLLTENVIGSRYYFVHSYYASCKDHYNAVGITNHGIDFHSAVEKQNVYGVQFHPEKSHRFGMSLLRKFAEL